MDKERKQDVREDFRKETEELLASQEENLSDFALFLSVMRHKKAYQNVLSIIMGEQDLQLVQVHVEEVVLNKSGKRAIRLDARGQDEKGRNFATEMQNDTSKDDMRRRARFYQSLLDTPVLKSGRKTKYKELPPTVIIFITQDDIFKRDLAKYTFRERCEELGDLYLEDGTTKIFLNMKSQNGSPELVSLLQYMKRTTLDNPEIRVKDERIVELDKIVQEVKESEEWEAVRMSILSIGMEKGMEKGMDRGIEVAKKVFRLSAQGMAPEEIARRLDIPVEKVKQIMDHEKLGGISISSVMGCGTQRGVEETGVQSAVPANLLPKIRVQIVLEDEKVEDIIARIRDEVATGHVGDGKIFVRDVEDAVRIRTGEHGNRAL